MDLYTMNDNFIADDVVDEFISAIWTERYSVAGDVQIVTAATPEMVTKLAEGTFIGLRGSREVMQLHTQAIQESQLTVVGSALTQFLNERPFWAQNPDYSTETSSPEQKIGDLTVNNKVGPAIANVVDSMVINTVGFTASLSTANLQWESEEIAYLTLGDISQDGDIERITFAIGPLYEAVSQVAAKFGFGIQLFLEYATLDTGYSLLFRVYKGENRTTEKSNKTGAGTFPENVTEPPPAVDWGKQLVRLVPDMDSLSNVKEIRSIAFYKNVAYVWYKGIVSVHYEDPANVPTGFDRRVMIVEAQGEPPARKVEPMANPNPRDWRRMNAHVAFARAQEQPDIQAFRNQQAKDALANHNYIKAVDGQTSPHNDYKFGVDYGLGDVIELQGLTGTLSKARVTEYIRAQDRTGEREYPTISVI